MSLIFRYEPSDPKETSALVPFFSRPRPQRNPQSTPPTPGLSLIQEDAYHLAFSYESLLVVFWRGPREPAACTAIYGTAVRLARTLPSARVGVVSILERSASPPTSKYRDALSRLHEDPEQVLHRLALVFPGDGFVAAAIRSFLLSITTQTAMRRGHHRVFAKLDGAIDWVTEGLPITNKSALSSPAWLAELEKRRRTVERRAV